MQAVLLLIAVILLALAGFNVGAPRFNPGWLGLGAAVAAFGWPILAGLG